MKISTERLLCKRSIVMNENGAKILIIDDDIELVDIIATKLENSGFSVLKAHNGKDGLEIAKEKKPQIIMLDLKMPEIDGLEVFEALKKDPATESIKIVIFSAFNEYQGMKLDAVCAKKIGAVDFFEKSIDTDVLVARIKSIL